jgi:hypothetical protein
MPGGNKENKETPLFNLRKADFWTNHFKMLRRQGRFYITLNIKKLEVGKFKSVIFTHKTIQ